MTSELQPSFENAYRILVVEDDQVSQKVIRHVLGLRFQVNCADSGKDALDAASRSQYDLILMDLQMPDMDGLEATERIRELAAYKQVPILALTANESEEYRHLCRQYGMQAFLAKPVQSGELLSAIARFLK